MTWSLDFYINLPSRACFLVWVVVPPALAETYLAVLFLRPVCNWSLLVPFQTDRSSDVFRVFGIRCNLPLHQLDIQR